MNLAMQARLSIVLAAACAVFGVLALLFWLGVGTGYSFLEPNTDTVQELPSVSTIEKQNFQMPEFAHFAEITQRPLFSQDRQPIPPDQDQGEDKPEAPPVPLQVQLTGVILTPGLKMALLKDRTTNKDINVKEGMPLPGKQSAWLLVEIEPRKVVFKNDHDETSEVELTVSKTSGPPSQRVSGSRPAPNPTLSPPNKPNQPNPPANNAQKSLRERIEERRKELREQARKMRAQQQARQQQQEKSR